MRFTFLLLGTTLAAVSAANDHANIETGRPLRFDDAYSVGLGERSVSLGIANHFKRRKSQYASSIDFKFGVALNQDLTFSADPLISTPNRQSSIGVSYFYGIQREINETPALGFRLSVHQDLTNQKEWEGQARVVISKSGRGHGKWHLNGDINFDKDEAKVAASLGYSVPLGVPRRFDQILLAQVGWEQLSKSFHSGFVGLGLRKQLSSTAIFDIGLEVPVVGPRQEIPSTLRIGYSVSF